MKKWAVPVIVLSVVLISFILFFAYQIFYKEIKVSSLESLVPEDTIYYIYSYGLNKKMRDFQSSPFFQQFLKLNFYRERIQSKLDKITKEVPFLTDFIKGDTAFAIFSFGDAENYGRNFPHLGNFIFLTRIDRQKFRPIRKQLFDFYLSIASKDDIGYEKYKGIGITRYRLPRLKTTINFALLSDVFVFSNNNDIMRQSIDLFKSQNNNSLLYNKTFQKVVAKVNRGALLWGYVNQKSYYQQMLNNYAVSLRRSYGSDDAGAADFTKVKPLLNLMNIFEAYAWYLDYNELKNGFLSKSYHCFDRTAEKSDLLNILTCDKPLDKYIFNLIPRDVTGFWCGNQNLVSMWKFLRIFSVSMDEIMKSRIKARGIYQQYKDRFQEMSTDNMIKNVESFLGVNIQNDLLTLLGNNFGVVLSSFDDEDIAMVINPAQPDLQQKTGFSIIFPKFYFFAELKDNSKTQEVMKGISQRIVDNANNYINEQENKYKEQQSKMQSQFQAERGRSGVGTGLKEEKQYLRIQMDNYKNIPINSIEILDFPLTFLRPNYCILDKYLILSLSMELTKKIIDTYTTKVNSLNSNYDFSSIQDRMPPEYSNIMFFNCRKMILDIKNTSFFKTFESQLSKNKNRQSSRETLNSTLDILSNIYSFSFSNRLSDANTMESISYIKIKGL